MATVEVDLTRALVSGWVGYLSTAFSVASYCPTIASNWARKSNVTTPFFIYFWLFGDVFTIMCTILMKPRFVLYVFNFWCFFGDIILFAQLQFYGSPAPGARKVLKGSIILERLQVYTSSNTAKKWSNRMKTWDDWDKIKTGLICTLMGTGFWAVLQTLSWNSSTKTNSSMLILISGSVGTAVFVVSRLFELHNGFFNLMPLYLKDRIHDTTNIQHHVSALTPEEQIRIGPPSISKESIMFYFTIASNSCQVLCIVIYSLDMAYLGPQLPWVIGPLLATLLDICILVFATKIWWPAYRRTATYYQVKDETERLEAKRRSLKRELDIIDRKFSEDNMDKYEFWFQRNVEILEAKINKYSAASNLKKQNKAMQYLEKERQVYEEVKQKWFNLR